MLHEERQLVLENLGLAGHIAKRFQIERGIVDYDDLVQTGKIGLIKAAITYNPEKGKFSSYATTIIENEIKMVLRKERKNERVVSLQEPINIGLGESNIVLEDLRLKQSNDFLMKFETNAEDIYYIEEAIEYVLNELSQVKRLVMLYSISGKKQDWIAQKIGISQSYVSRIEKECIKNIRAYFKNGNSSKKYPITFILRKEKGINFCGFNQDFSINCRENRIFITVFSGIECLENIANIIQEMNEFNFWI